MSASGPVLERAGPLEIARAGATGDRGETPADRAVPRRGLTGGIVAHNEERSIAAAIRSLLEQELPPEVEWERIWVVGSGCTDRTIPIVREFADRTPLVRLIAEPERQGKSQAIDRVFQQALGTDLVLLNADAVAQPGAVAELLRAAEGRARPYAIMGRPFVPGDEGGPFERLVRLQWALHHETHLELLAGGRGNHLSDELLLLSVPDVPGIPAGVVNDGSYFGAWLSSVGGGLGYAPAARVAIAAPNDLSDHLLQRRRIRDGHRQVAAAFRSSPVTLPAYARNDPVAAFRLLRRTVRDRPGGWLDLFGLAAAEGVAIVLSELDRLRGAPTPVRWRRVRTRPVAEAPVLSVKEPVRRAVGGAAVAPTDEARCERRVRALLAAAEQFGTGVRLEELDRLLPLEPQDSPSGTPELAAWLRHRPTLARVEGHMAFAPTLRGRPDPERRARGLAYAARAERLLGTTLRDAVRWTEVIGLTGSTAFGEPERGDDLDFFVVTRGGALWIFLALTYLGLRLRRPGDEANDALEPCFNTVLDAAAAREEFSRPGDRLFAREAASVVPVRGEAEYAELLGRAEWIDAYFPRIRARETPVGPPAARRSAPAPIRLLNALLFPWIAAYLQLRGMERNHAYRRSGASEGSRFRTATSLRRMTFSSGKFERLRQVFETEVGAPGGSGTSAIRSEKVGPPDNSRLPARRAPNRAVELAPPDLGSVPATRN